MMSIDLSGLKDYKTTIIGSLVIAGATMAMLTGKCSFDRWWEIVLFVMGIMGGTGLLLAKDKKAESPPPSRFTDSSAGKP